MTDYTGVMKTEWPATWTAGSPSTPLALQEDIRGGLHSIKGTGADTLTNISGKRISPGMLVYDRAQGKYFKYTLMDGQQAPNTGSYPNDNGNWVEFDFVSFYKASGVENFPVEGDSDSLYIDISNWSLYVWEGSSYKKLTSDAQSSHFKGEFSSVETLPETGEPGDYTLVKPGNGNAVVLYLWDDANEKWSSSTAHLDPIPTKLSELVNDEGFITIDDVPSGGGGDSPLVFTGGDEKTLVGYDNGEVIKPVRSASIENNVFKLTLASFTPTLTATLTQTSLNWDTPFTGALNVSVTNPSDYTSSYISSVEGISSTDAIEADLGEWITSGPTPAPAGGVSWTQSFALGQAAYVRSSTDDLTGGSASGTVTFNVVEGSDPEAVYQDTANFNVNWKTANVTITLSGSSQIFLKTVAELSFNVSTSNVSPSNVTHSITSDDGTISGSTVILDNALQHKDSVSVTVKSDTTFTRPLDVTGTSYQINKQVTSSISSLTWIYPSFHLFNEDTPDNADLIDVDEFASNVTVMGNKTKALSGTITNTGSSPTVWWFGVASAAPQPTSFKSGASSELISDVQYITESVELSPDNDNEFISEPYTLYGIVVQPGDLYIKIS